MNLIFVFEPEVISNVDLLNEVKITNKKSMQIF